MKLEQKVAIEKYKLAKRTNSPEYQQLREYAIQSLVNIFKQPFDAGNVKIGILQ